MCIQNSSSLQTLSFINKASRLFSACFFAIRSFILISICATSFRVAGVFSRAALCVLLLLLYSLLFDFLVLSRSFRFRLLCFSIYCGGFGLSGWGLAGPFAFLSFVIHSWTTPLHALSSCCLVFVCVRSTSVGQLLILVSFFSVCCITTHFSFCSLN
ncbi:unnamed protein product [Moneuplotes crassus]|uniref:Uncharacterized protein n=1 Tax=Euplotes crassus TaxID=5936 RepID=A0AAD1XTK0_EUPCR|nr:unnamed protein product [Moneuplotes crassus]